MRGLGKLLAVSFAWSWLSLGVEGTRQSLLKLQRAWVLLSELACLAPPSIKKDNVGSDKGMGKESGQVHLTLALELETEFLPY